MSGSRCLTKTKLTLWLIRFSLENFFIPFFICVHFKTLFSKHQDFVCNLEAVSLNLKSDNFKMLYFWLILYVRQEYGLWCSSLLAQFRLLQSATLVFLTTLLISNDKIYLRVRSLWLITVDLLEKVYNLYIPTPGEIFERTPQSLNDWKPHQMMFFSTFLALRFFSATYSRN